MTAITPSFPLNADTRIPAVGFGTFLIDPDKAADAVRTAIEFGYRHVDTAEIYANETAVGAGLRQMLSNGLLSRADMFVTTKLWPGLPAWGEQPKSKTETIAAFHASLDRLGLDYLDLYLIHSPHGGAQRLAQWEGLLALQQAGKVRSIGVSNYGRDHLEEIRSAGLPTPDANQIELHPWTQKPALLAYLRTSGIAPVAYSSLAPLSTWRVGQTSAKTEEMNGENIVFTAMAAKYGVTEAQLLLRWGIQNGYAVLPKSLNQDRMRENLNLFSFSIDEHDMNSLAQMDRGNGLAWSMGDPTMTT
jgi:2,5-diketo-D-gluconate reductase A